MQEKNLVKKKMIASKNSWRFSEASEIALVAELDLLIRRTNRNPLFGEQMSEKEAKSNIFDILRVPAVERPNDLIISWLCDGTYDHGISDFAAQIIRVLWKNEFYEVVRAVECPYRLESDCLPDVGIQFDLSLLLIENKVDPSAVTLAQLLRQHSRGMAKQRTRPLYHILLCPNWMVLPEVIVASASFRVLRYGELASLLRKMQSRAATENARSIIGQYADYVDEQYGGSLPQRRMRLSSQTGVWTEADFFAQVPADLQHTQQALLKQLRETSTVDVKFVSTGRTNPTYRIFVKDTGIHFLWPYFDGKIHVCWEFVAEAAIADKEAGKVEAANQKLKAVRLLKEWSEAGPQANKSKDLPQRLGQCDVETVVSMVREITSLCMTDD